MLLNAMLWGAAYGILPYFLLIQTGLIGSGMLKSFIVFISIVVFLIATILNFLDFRVNEITLTDKEILYKHASWGRVIVSSVNIADIKWVYVMPRTRSGGVSLHVAGNNPLEGFVTIGYSLRQISPIKERLKQLGKDFQQGINITDDAEVNPKRLFKLISVVVGIILVFSAGLIWWVIASGSK
jgi:hypothetical protein